MTRALLLPLLLLAACDRAPAPTPTPTSAATPAPLAADAVPRYLAAIRDASFPMGFLFTGYSPAAGRIGERIGEYDAWCRAKGYEGFEEFFPVSGRIQRALMVLEHEAFEKSLLDAYREQLGKPDLAPARRAQLESLLADAKKRMDDVARQWAGVSIPAADLEAVRPHQADLRAAIEARQLK